jgi:phosphoribosylaminoimidazole-succinocarboxamide synthase
MEEILPLLEKAGARVSAELRETLEGRSLLGVKTQALPIECVVRGYMAGSLWKEYRQAGGVEQGASLHGYAFPAGLQESERLPEPIFTPATKAEEGHDENISVAQAAVIVGEERAQALLEKSVAIYRAAAEFALQQGILLADTKFEFGVREGKLIWIDEALTPDSSRFWDDAIYAPGCSQPSYDKQFVRDWLEASGWNKQPPAPTLPTDIVEKTAEKYCEAYRRLTGETLK